MNGITRPLDSVGRIVIPKEMREVLNWNTGDEIEISITPKGIELVKYSPGCLICNSEFNLVSLGNYKFCRKCISWAIT